LEARIQAMETAFRMQSAASDTFDIRREPQKVRDEYGGTHFANACLLARRLSERGVRFVQVYYGNGQPWDTHRHPTPTTPNPPAAPTPASGGWGRASAGPAPPLLPSWSGGGSRAARLWSGAASSAARPPRRAATGATTTTGASPPGWPAAAPGAA